MLSSTTRQYAQSVLPWFMITHDGLVCWRHPKQLLGSDSEKGTIICAAILQIVYIHNYTFMLKIIKHAGDLSLFWKYIFLYFVGMCSKVFAFLQLYLAQIVAKRLVEKCHSNICEIVQWNLSIVINSLGVKTFVHIVVKCP